MNNIKAEIERTLKMNLENQLETVSENYSDDFTTDHQENIENVKNPFFVSMKGGTALSIGLHEIYTKYDYCYAMIFDENEVCFKEEIDDIMDTYYKKDSSIDDLKKISSAFILIKIDSRILFDINFRKNTNIISGKILEEIFGYHRAYQFQNDELVVPFLNMPMNDAKMYLKLYVRPCKIDDVLMIVNAANVLNPKYVSLIEEKLNNTMDEIDNDKFWQKKKNCKIQYKDVFSRRYFSYKGMRLDKMKTDNIHEAKDIMDLITEMKENNRSKKVHNNDNLENKSDTDSDASYNNTYMMPDGDCALNKAEFQNLYGVLRNQESRTYYIDNNVNDLNMKDKIATLFEQIVNDKIRYKLFNILLTSKKYCHLVYNNKRVLDRNADLFSKYRAYYSYALYYAHLSMYLEESIMGIKTHKRHRHVFDIETASSLPTFPFTKNDLKRNPYLTIILPDEEIDAKNNYVGMHAPIDHQKYMGITTKDEAMRRLNTFCTGHPDKNMFDIEGIDKDNMSVSGSVMPACLQKLPQLFEKCSPDDCEYKTRWNTYFKHYYQDSDIDIMYKCDQTIKLLVFGTKFIKHICKLLQIKREEIEIKPCKNSSFIVTKHFFTECLDDVNSVMNTNYTGDDLSKMFEQIKSKKFSTDFADLLEEYFYSDYVVQNSKRKMEIRTAKKNINDNNDITDDIIDDIIDDELYRYFTRATDFKDFDVKLSTYELPESKIIKKDTDVYFFVNDFREEKDKVSPEENYLVFKYGETFKFKISSKKLNRDIEIFKIDTRDPFNTVARFHLPCVRAYYQNNNFYMLPSFITSMHTGINIDYKYFAGSRDPANICHKYLTRGFGIILNKTEKIGIVKYSKAVDEYNGMYKIENDDDIFGPKELNHKFFCPGIYKLGLNKDVYLDTQGENMKNLAKTETDVMESYKNESGYDPSNSAVNIFKIDWIDDDGMIRPYEPWIAEAFWSMMNHME